MFFWHVRSRNAMARVVAGSGRRRASVSPQWPIPRIDGEDLSGWTHCEQQTQDRAFESIR